MIPKVISDLKSVSRLKRLFQKLAHCDQILAIRDIPQLTLFFYTFTRFRVKHNILNAYNVYMANVVIRGQVVTTLADIQL